ncbi:hypothetical protein AUEXF2481DRAFT_462064 [Aureobasidium subglaciale EXF-2481]|uniref:Uncharacterized protein n=1 Tax=Aureobasidium subglaciale (strain EXF-2481) TaxID=1043005 RepID=A0A074Y1E5_AURSE|nr:uncharacterized protein AUEXF2481DRAFT_462064 [Aureobasidium subglaciale EXF-2481]KEQ91550.1 hypothetical protein AUEXF2481DRAFT_462064 [Aureobasidium subglaciale EXF-2481]
MILVLFRDWILLFPTAGCPCSTFLLFRRLQFMYISLLFLWPCVRDMCGAELHGKFVLRCSVWVAHAGLIPDAAVWMVGGRGLACWGFRYVVMSVSGVGIMLIRCTEMFPRAHGGREIERPERPQMPRARLGA